MYRYIVAIYLRLSVDDKRVESMSIESQRLLLRKYAEILGDNVEIIGEDEVAVIGHGEIKGENKNEQ